MQRVCIFRLGMRYSVLLLAIVAIIPFFAACNGQNGGGLTFDLCQVDSDCRPPRNCKYFQEESSSIESCRAEAPSCLCVADQLTLCKYGDADNDEKSCPAGERCVKYTNNNLDFCMSCETAKISNTNESFQVPNGDAVTCNIPFDPPSSVGNRIAGGSETGEGRNFDPCTTLGYCKSPRSCVTISESNIAYTCNGATDCRCRDLTNAFVCTSQDECSDDRERCGRHFSQNEAYRGQCTSLNVINTDPDYFEIRESQREKTDSGSAFSGDRSSGPGNSSNTPSQVPGDPDNGTVCIDASLLTHLDASQLIFGAHRRASVLCDGHGSCATPGHMVQYAKSVMSMSTYCETRAVCSKRVAWVNSPKFQRRLRIQSHTRGLSFTPLAARYETVLEERGLQLLVALGF